MCDGTARTLMIIRPMFRVGSSMAGTGGGSGAGDAEERAVASLWSKLRVGSSSRGTGGGGRTLDIRSVALRPMSLSNGVGGRRPLRLILDVTDSDCVNARGASPR